MCEALEELMKDELEAKRAEGMIQGRAQGRAEGILALLNDLGQVPESLQVKIMAQKNTEVLNQWLKYAAKAETINDFVQKTNSQRS